MKITIQTIINADSKKVWDFYTQPEHITKWNFASPDWQCPSASNDMKVGGKYQARMEAKDGSFGFDFEAVYNEIIEGEEFTYTMPDAREVNVQFQKAENGTELIITFDPEKENSIDMQRAGWQSILDNFKKYVESNKEIKNPIRWFEIYVSDMDRAKKFYESVFDVELTEMSKEMWGFPSNPDKWGCSGALVKMTGLVPSGIGTIVYFGSEDCAIEEKRLLEFGGKVHKTKFAIGEYGFIVLGTDTEGNMIGIHSME